MTLKIAQVTGLQMNEIFTALLSDPTALTRNALRILHFIGLAFGIGAATMLDLIVLRFFVGKPISSSAFDIFKFGASIVNVGIWTLWISGMGFLLFYAFFDPVKLTNEKVWAKMVIVLILTINGMFIHKAVLPVLKAQVGKSIFEGLDIAKRRTLISVGTISVVSWYAPLIIANLSALNFTIPALQILLAYAVVLLIVLTASNLVLGTKLMPKSDRAGPASVPGKTEQANWQWSGSGRKQPQISGISTVSVTMTDANKEAEDVRAIFNPDLPTP